MALRFFRSGVTAAAKADGSPVTEADLAVEALLRAEIAKAFPGDALLGEEHGREGEWERLWTVDPIDGTGLFSVGDPHWRVHVAFSVAGRTEVAVVTSPALGVRWWARRGGGAVEATWPGNREPRPLTVSSVATVDEATLIGMDTATRPHLPTGFQPPRTALPLVELVRGQLEAFLVERYFAWDHAPWILIVQEAGGRFTDPLGGTAADQGGGLYSTARLHDQLRDALGYPRPKGA